MNRYCVIIPTYNEEKAIKQTIEGFTKSKIPYDIYVCDNNSTDNTIQIAKDCGATVIIEEKQGKGYAVKKLFDTVKNKGYECVIMIDGDNTYDTTNISHLIFNCIHKHTDMVIGDRLSSNYYLENKKHVNSMGNKLAKLFTTIFISKEIKDPLSGLRVFSPKFVNNYPCNVHGFELETDMNVFAAKKGYKIHSTTIKYRDRVEGSFSKIKLSDGFKIIKHTIYCMFKCKKGK